VAVGGQADGVMRCRSAATLLPPATATISSSGPSRSLGRQHPGNCQGRELPHLTATQGIRRASPKAGGSPRKALPVATVVASAPGDLEAIAGRGEASTLPKSCRLIHRNGAQRHWSLTSGREAGLFGMPWRFGGPKFVEVAHVVDAIRARSEQPQVAARLTDADCRLVDAWPNEDNFTTATITTRKHAHLLLPASLFRVGDMNTTV
jgi:hypothetical protein